jgi:hypothetical protein
LTENEGGERKLMGVEVLFLKQEEQEQVSKHVSLDDELHDDLEDEC